MSFDTIPTATASHTLKFPRSITHPLTGQLMAPGSRVWPYFIDDTKLGRQWIGPKQLYPLSLSTRAESGQDPSMIELDSRQAEAATLARKTSGTEDHNRVLQTVPTIASSNESASATRSDKGREQKRGRYHGPTQVQRPGRRGNIDIRYEKLLERRTTLRHQGKLDQSNIIQAGINAGVLLGWNKTHVIRATERLEKATARGVDLQIRGGSGTAKTMEVAAEIEHINFKAGLKDLRKLRDAYKGPLYNGVPDLDRVRNAGWRAPGLLMLIQAALSVSFLKCIEGASDLPANFDTGVFDGKAVLYFRTPTRTCGEERVYLLQMSKIGTAGSTLIRYAACPGIERALKAEEKAAILHGIRKQITYGRGVIELVTEIFGKSIEIEAADSRMADAGVTKTAMGRLSDEGFLVLEYVYRKKVGFPILIGDEVIEGEEEEPEEDGSDFEDLRISMPGYRLPGQAINDEGMAFEHSRPSLVVTLRYRRV